jgi:hypothetical protein
MSPWKLCSVVVLCIAPKDMPKKADLRPLTIKNYICSSKIIYAHKFMHGKYLRKDIPIRKPNSSSNCNGRERRVKEIKETITHE